MQSKRREKFKELFKNRQHIKLERSISHRLLGAKKFMEEQDIQVRK